MHLQSFPSAERLTPSQANRLQYIAHCGPVFRTPDDDELLRLKLVQPFRRIRGILEATSQGRGAAGASQESRSLAMAAS